MALGIEARVVGQIAVVGVAESDLGIVPDVSAVQLQAQASARALREAGLTARDVDGLFVADLVNPLPGLLLAEYLGITPRYSDTTGIGGSSFVAHLEHASAAIQAGLCSVALIAYGSTQRSDGSRARRVVDPRSPEGQFETPYGTLAPLTAYALAAQRHMYEYGTTAEHLASIAVSTRQWAQMNPVAMMRDPLSVEQVLASRVISSPLHLLDCCLVTDGGGAVVVTGVERARDMAQRPVVVLGTGECHTHATFGQMRDMTRTGAAISGRRAFAQAGLRPIDIDVAEIYDSFTITVLLSLEDLGFCEKGAGGPFVGEGRLGPGGSLPTNTQGGGLSYTHPGMFGIFTVIEATRQLRGECGDRQVAGARVALCHGTGGQLSSHATAILARL